MSTKYTPRNQFVPFHNRKQRWASMNTHRRAGKTVALVNDLVFGAVECGRPKPILAYIGPTYAQAKRVAWQYLIDFAEPYLAKAPQVSELKVTLKNDATIYVLGADNADALRGMYLDGAVMDEYALFRPSVFSQVIRPALSDRNGWGCFASTPRGKNLFYETQRGAEMDPQNWYSLTLRADTSGIIAPAELDELRKDMDEEEFAQEYLCSFDSALKGAIYADEVNMMFNDGRVSQEQIYDPSLEVHWCFDLGMTDATVAIAFQIAKDGEVRIVSVEATKGATVFHHIERIHQFRGKVGTVWLPHDAKQANNQTGTSVVEQFVKNGIRPRGVPMHKVRDGIFAARKIFPRVRIYEPGTGELLEALKTYHRKWDDRTMMFSDTPEHDWSSDYADAFRYVAIAIGLLSDTAMAVATPMEGETFRDGKKYHAYAAPLDELFAEHAARMKNTRIS